MLGLGQYWRRPPNTPTSPSPPFPLASGPVEHALSFFTRLGFACPPRKDPASFLLEVTTPIGQLTYATEGLLKSKRVRESRRTPHNLIINPPASLLVLVEDIAGGCRFSEDPGVRLRGEVGECYLGLTAACVPGRGGASSREMTSQIRCLRQ